MSAPGMNIVKLVFDGEKGYTEQMGNRVPLEGQDLSLAKDQSMLFPETKYNTNGYALELKGIEDVDGKPAYKLIVTKPSGSKSTEYYDKNTFLKIREIKSEEAGGQTVTITNDFTNYKMVDGVMIPHTISISGQMPVPMVMEAKAIKINAAVEPDLFKI